MIREDIVEETEIVIEKIEEVNKSLNDLKGYVKEGVRFDVMQVEQVEQNTEQAIISLEETIDCMKNDYLDDMVLSCDEVRYSLDGALSEIKKVAGANTRGIEIKIEDILEKVNDIKDKVDELYDEDS